MANRFSHVNQDQLDSHNGISHSRENRLAMNLLQVIIIKHLMQVIKYNVSHSAIRSSLV